MAKNVNESAERDRLRRWEIFFNIALVLLLVITAMAWGWKEFLIVLFLGGTIEWVITDGKRKLEIQALDRTASWLKRRLELVDPHWQEAFMGVSDGQPRLHPPPDEVVCKYPKCNREIKRRELDHRFNGGWSTSRV